MSVHAEHNRRIALNTIILYGRMAFVMGCGLFTTRALLSALGPVDFGLVNVIAGVVTMFGFLSSSMNVATSRFFSFDLGAKDYDRLAKTFGLARLVFFILAAVVFILAEVGGLWLIEHELVIPEGRMNAAKWLFHGALLGFLVSMITIPYSSLVLAHENMRLYSKISIMDAFLKLGLAISIGFAPVDRLALYGGVLFFIPLVSFVLYYFSCRSAYSESKSRLYFDRVRFKELMNFSGWNLFGAFSGIVNGAGLNVLLNVFFGPSVNAARAIAFQVSGAVSGLTTGFIQASAPQVVKYYAEGEYAHMQQLVVNAARYGFLLLIIGIVPLLVEMKYFLGIWLGEVPGSVVLFTSLVLVNVLIDSFSFPLMQAAQAVGNIARYQSWVGFSIIMSLPISYLILAHGAPAYAVFIVTIGTSVLALVIRLALLRRMMGLRTLFFIRKVFVPCGGTVIAVIALVSPILFFGRFIPPFFVALLCCAMTLLAVFVFGLHREERIALIKRLKRFYENNKKNS